MNITCNTEKTWMGIIPSHWKIGRIDGFYTLRNVKVSDNDYQPLSVTMKGVLPQLETAAKTNAHDDRKLVKIGDFAINSRSDRRGSCGISDYEGSVSLINTILAPKGEMHPKYYDWLFHTVQFADEFYKWGHGIVDDLWTTTYQDMKKILIPVPPIAEQQQISDFLDIKCKRIDTLLSNIQTEIETLERYRMSKITEIVIKGIEKNIRLKDSFVEWIGKIPESWTVKRAKYVFVQKTDKGNNNSLVLLSPTQNYGVIPQEMYEQLSGFSAVKLNEGTDLNSLKTVHKGAFVISLRSFQGGFEYSKYEGVVSPAYQVFYPYVTICDGYYKYLFKTQIFIDKMNSYTMSLRDGKNISFFDFGRTYLPIPPIDEQNRISEYLDVFCHKIDAIIDNKRKMLDYLSNYKKSFVFEYVTGKKEISNG